MKGLEAMMAEVPKDRPSTPEEKDELADAMSDLGEALSDKDWSAAATAFRRAHEICGTYEADEDETDEEK